MTPVLEPNQLLIHVVKHFSFFDAQFLRLWMISVVGKEAPAAINHILCCASQSNRDIEIPTLKRINSSSDLSYRCLNLG